MTGAILESATNVVVAVEIVVGLYIALTSRGEARFLEQQVKPLLRGETELPLFDSLLWVAKYVKAVAAWLIVLTVLGALLSWLDKPSLADLFPPIRAINLALLIGLLAVPKIIGRGLRRRVVERETEAAT